MVDFSVLLQQLGGLTNSKDFDPANPLAWVYIISLAIIPIFMLYGQKMQSKIILGEISKSLVTLKDMRDGARRDTIDYVKGVLGSRADPSGKIDKFLEYFTIMPVEMDPTGLVRKVEHVLHTKDEHMRSEVRRICPGIGDYELSKIENILEAATALNMIYKVVRHYFLMGKRTTSMFVLVQLQMVMPLLIEEASAMKKAIGAFQKGQPIGDGIGPMVVGRMMLGKEKIRAAKETVYSEAEHAGRKLYLLKAEGPSGTVGRPGEAIVRLVEDLGLKIDAIVMIDAALKLEGEKTGDVAEGIGAAVGGIGVERYHIEEIATKFDIPVYAVIVKQSIQDAITIMRKEIADSIGKVADTVHGIIEDKTEEGQSILVIGVGNTMGVAQ